MKIIRKKWHKWFTIPLAVLLILAIVLPIQLSRQPEKAYASGVAATSVTLTSQTSGSHTFVQFNISWEYSWRDTGNWDAAWIFVKYQVGSGDWQHATLSATSAEHTAPSGSTIDAVSDGTGVFIYRSAIGSGTVSWSNVQLRWNYATDGVADSAQVTVKVFATEMVYIPTDAFYVGDADGDQRNCFYEGGATSPFQITSEGEITVDDTAGNLYYDADNSNGGDRLGPIPAAFPKGYQAFYMMKYEVSQRQYAEFLNTLTATQAGNRFPDLMIANRQYIRESGGVYGVDANGNGTFNESDDGEWIAANGLSWADGAAYADWAGMRPMTELEFEKAARGPAAVVDDEYVWGSVTLIQATDKTNLDLVNEGPSPADANAAYERGAGMTNAGPYRVGAFTDADDSREQAGATYYGAMELGGNVSEQMVTVGNSAGRAFTGLHGDGALTTAGDADVSLWPGADAVGAGRRGGNWRDVVEYLRISNRGVVASPNNSTRSLQLGARVARTP